MSKPRRRPVLLLTGASRGLGKAIDQRFAADFELVRVSRTAGEIRGDISDLEFRNRLLEEVSPAVVINNAGIYPKGRATAEVLRVNAEAAMDLTVRFAEKMKRGHIVNISSVSAGLGLLPFASLDEINYTVSKKALSNFGEMLQYANIFGVKITTLEPAMMMTTMADISERFQARHPKDFLTRRKIKPMDPAYVAKIIEWVIRQPDEVVISNIRIMNRPERPNEFDLS